MQENRRSFFIVAKHKRLTRLWQFFFTGWGLAMIVALIAGALFTKQMLWTPISAINLTELTTNQFKMTNATFSGIDKDNNPFSVHAVTGRQEYNSPNIIFLDDVSSTITKNKNGKITTNKIKSNRAEYNREQKTITLIGQVFVDSSDGTKILTDELVIEL